jgi:HEAT repeat protein
LIAVVLGELTAGRVDSGTKSEPSTLQRARMELVALGPLSANALSEVLVLGAGLGPVAVEELLIQIGGPAVEPLLIQLARDDTPTARRRASRTLGEIAFQRIPAGMTTEAVRAALSERLQKDKDWIVRSQCALALASWGRSTPQDMSSSAGQLVRGLVDPDDQVRRDVIQALGRLGDPRTLPALINHLERSINAGELGEIVTTQKALGVLSGEAKKRTPEQWRAWWRDHRPRILERIQAEAQN